MIKKMGLAIGLLMSFEITSLSRSIVRALGSQLPWELIVAQQVVSFFENRGYHLICCTSETVKAVRYKESESSNYGTETIVSVAIIPRKRSAISPELRSKLKKARPENGDELEIHRQDYVFISGCTSSMTIAGPETELSEMLAIIDESKLPKK